MTKEKPILFSAPMVNAILSGQKTQTRRVVKHDLQYAQCDSNNMVKSYPSYHVDNSIHRVSIMEIIDTLCPYGAVGDELWVRENFKVTSAHGSYQNPHNIDDFHCGSARIEYKDGEHKIVNNLCVRMDGVDESEQALRIAKKGNRMTPSIHMPRWASRLQLRIKDVRVERLQSISEDDAMREGIMCQNVIVDVQCYGGAPHEITDDRYFNGVDDGVDSFGYETAYDAFKALWVSINGQKSWDENPWVWAIEFERIKP